CCIQRCFCCQLEIPPIKSGSQNGGICSSRRINRVDGVVSTVLVQILLPTTKANGVFLHPLHIRRFRQPSGGHLYWWVLAYSNSFPDPESRKSGKLRMRVFV